jgi:hypothetical protein
MQGGAETTLPTAVSDLSSARELASVTAVVRVAARALTGADGVTFVLKEPSENRGTAVRVEFPVLPSPSVVPSRHDTTQAV